MLCCILIFLYQYEYDTILSTGYKLDARKRTSIVTLANVVTQYDTNEVLQHENTRSDLT